ncbi:MAG TPA: M23 family metallopeptidase [Flavisolibacter sp.]|jgi:murein DD-endopeptidase MepM/ murein hydrolase activator NlpD
MKRLLTIALLLAFLSGCRTSGPGIFGKQSPHEQYSKKLSDAGLKETALGGLWFSSAERALAQPQTVSVPYRQTGYFADENPRAVGLQFTSRRGQKLIFRLEKKPRTSFTIYTELWRVNSGRAPSLLTSMDTTATEFSHEVDDEQETFILRLQPELLRSGEYTLSISVGPSLGFPVSGKSARVGSVWGDSRDAGARRHEGIDIFAPKRTPVIAAADGTVNRVEETTIGGKVVWLRPEGRPINLYYAHLDEQLVSAGQRVRLGDTLGLVGNTGNARTTPPHLHFGIYGFGGAINPLPYVEPNIKESPTVRVAADKLNTYYRTVRDVQLADGLSLKKNSIVFATDADAQFYMGILADGRNVKIRADDIQQADNQILALKLRDSAAILEQPLAASPAKQYIRTGTSVKVRGYYNDHALVSTEAGIEGWLPRRLLQ